MTRNSTAQPPGTTGVVCLVGENPLPALLTASMLRPARVVLCPSPATREVAGHLKETLARCLPSSEPAVVRIIADAGSAAAARDVVAGAVRELMAEDGGTVALDYTGGTKAMAVGACEGFRALQPDPRRRSYLHSGPAGHGRSAPARWGRLRFADGTEQAVAGPANLTLGDVLGLHGATVERSAEGPPRGGGHACKASGGRNGAPPQDRCAHCRLAWLVADYLRKGAATGPDPAASGEVRALLTCQLHGQPVWLDVAGLQGARVTVLTVEHDPGAKRGGLKLRLLEALVRATQIGGRHARAALVTCVPQQDPQRHWDVAALEREVADELGFPEAARVFAGVEPEPGLPGAYALRRWWDE